MLCQGLVKIRNKKRSRKHKLSHCRVHAVWSTQQGQHWEGPGIFRASSAWDLQIKRILVRNPFFSGWWFSDHCCTNQVDGLSLGRGGGRKVNSQNHSLSPSPAALLAHLKASQIVIKAAPKEKFWKGNICRNLLKLCKTFTPRFLLWWITCTET